MIWMYDPHTPRADLFKQPVNGNSIEYVLEEIRRRYISNSQGGLYEGMHRSPESHPDPIKILSDQTIGSPGCRLRLVHAIDVDKSEFILIGDA